MAWEGARGVQEATAVQGAAMAAAAVDCLEAVAVAAAVVAPAYPAVGRLARGAWCATAGGAS